MRAEQPASQHDDSGSCPAPNNGYSGSYNDGIRLQQWHTAPTTAYGSKRRRRLQLQTPAPAPAPAPTTSPAYVSYDGAGIRLVRRRWHTALTTAYSSNDAASTRLQRRRRHTAPTRHTAPALTSAPAPTTAYGFDDGRQGNSTTDEGTTSKNSTSTSTAPTPTSEATA